LNRVKALIIIAFVAAIVVGTAVSTEAYPPFLAKARKFGAKDCLFCHAARGRRGMERARPMADQRETEARGRRG